MDKVKIELDRIDWQDIIRALQTRITVLKHRGVILMDTDRERDKHDADHLTRVLAHVKGCVQ